MGRTIQCRIWRERWSRSITPAVAFVRWLAVAIIPRVNLIARLRPRTDRWVRHLSLSFTRSLLPTAFFLAPRSAMAQFRREKLKAPAVGARVIPTARMAEFSP